MKEVTYKSYDDLPLMLSVPEMAAVLGIRARGSCTSACKLSWLSPTHSHAPRGPSDSERPEVTHSPSFPQTPGRTQTQERPTPSGRHHSLCLSSAAEAERTFPQEARLWQPRPLARCVMGVGL